MLKISNKIFLLFALLTLVACKKDSTSFYEMKIEYWTSKEFNFSEKINVEKIKSDKSTRFYYDYINFHSGIDSLIIYSDSLYMNGIKLKYISEREFTYEGGIKVKKYLYSSDSPFDIINYYINNENGILLAQSESINGHDIFVEYNFGYGSEKVLNQIKKDSSFFKLEF